MILLYSGPTMFDTNTGNVCLEMYDQCDSSLRMVSIPDIQNEPRAAWGTYFNDTNPQPEVSDCWNKTDGVYTWISGPRCVGSPSNGTHTCDKAPECDFWDFQHYTILFNIFVFCQVFNEFNARQIGNKWNVFSGVFKNTMFMGVIVVTILLQVFIVELAYTFTKTSPITMDHWLASLGLGAVTVPLGIIMRFLPPQVESPASFS